jgi:uncharacterized protein Yka (UPF0111/DUF47 family)
MNPNESVPHRELRTSLTADGIKDVFNTLIMNLLQEITLFHDNISNFSEDLEIKLERIDSKNDYFSFLLRQILLKGIFLPISDRYFTQSIQKFDELIDLIQRIGHHLWLLRSPDWIVTHYNEMFLIIKEQLQNLSFWFIDQIDYNQELEKISQLENKADKAHKAFLKELFSKEENFKIFSQANLLDQTLEDITDSIERLSKQLFIFFNEYKTLTHPLPHYLP